jgi:hypothetical protein
VVIGPRLIELCFQAAGLDEVITSGRLALPTHVERVRFFTRPVESEGLVATAEPAEDGYRCAVVDPRGQVILQIGGYRTVPLPQAIAPDVLAPFLAI